VRRHRFDPVALVFGVVFVSAGLIVLGSGQLIDEGRALVPAGLIALGVALLVHVGRWMRPAPRVATPERPASVTSDTDIDRLFAPVDEELVRWEAEQVAPAPTAAGGADPTEVDPDRTQVIPPEIHDDATDADPDRTAVDPPEEGRG
jgi:hypothetical protein